MSQIPVEAEDAQLDDELFDDGKAVQQRVTLRLTVANAMALATSTGVWVLIFATATASGRADWMGILSAVEGVAYLATMTVPMWNIVTWRQTAAVWGRLLALSRMWMPFAAVIGPFGWFAAVMMSGATRPMIRALTIAGQARGTSSTAKRASGRGPRAGFRLGTNLAVDYAVAMVVSIIGACVVWSGLPLYYYAVGLVLPTLLAAFILGRHPWLRAIQPSQNGGHSQPYSNSGFSPRTARELSETIAKHLLVPYGRIGVTCGMVPVAAAIAADGDAVVATFASTLWGGGTALGIIISAYVMTARRRIFRLWRWHVRHYVARSSQHPVTLLAVVALGVAGVAHTQGINLHVIGTAAALGAVLGAASHVALHREFRWARRGTPTIATAHRSVLSYGTSLIFGAPLLGWAASVGGWSGFVIAGILYIIVWPCGWHGKRR